uniref:Ribosyldihydronicotinamide dehydrogenase [quinone] n=1 Tax=Gouania willdenowi TaxID=441366 RepID=A0A8C5GWD8_GOUWI
LKNVLIVYAHQSSGSFNAAAKDVAVEVLKASGCTVDVSDLYAINFKATATVEDITVGVKDPDCFCYAEETKLAWERNELSSDITKEQCKLKKADLVIFQFPMYWFSVPAIMKGWIDRVLTLGFAFSPEKCYGEGFFKDKMAMLSFTTGSHQSMFSANAINGDMNITLWPLQNGILHYCGFKVLAPEIFWAPAHVSRSECSTMLNHWRIRLGSLMSEKPLVFPPLDYFEKETGFQLKPEIIEKFATKEYGLAVGVHQGKKVPLNNQMRSSGCKCCSNRTVMPK